MTPSQLKYNHEKVRGADGEPSYYFTHDSMRHWGDTMKNYGVRSYDENTWELYRKHPVKDGVQKSAFFDKVTFRIRHII